jgi:hypothetical protein
MVAAASGKIISSIIGYAAACIDRAVILLCAINVVGGGLHRRFFCFLMSFSEQARHRRPVNFHRWILGHFVHQFPLHWDVR